MSLRMRHKTTTIFGAIEQAQCQQYGFCHYLSDGASQFTALKSYLKPQSKLWNRDHMFHTPSTHNVGWWCVQKNCRAHKILVICHLLWTYYLWFPSIPDNPQEIGPEYRQFLNERTGRNNFQRQTIQKLLGCNLLASEIRSLWLKNEDSWFLFSLERYCMYVFIHSRVYLSLKSSPRIRFFFKISIEENSKPKKLYTSTALDALQQPNLNLKLIRPFVLKL